MNRRRIIMGAINKSLLPPEYQQVEYIESTGEQYIDTGCYATLTSKINIECSINDPNSSNVYRVFGVRDSSNTAAFMCGKTSGSNNTIYTQFDTVSSTVVQSYSPTSNEVLDIELSSDGFKINGTLYREYENPTSFTSSSTIPLLAHISASTLSISLEPIRVYGCKLYTANALVRNYIPCYRKADSKPGMYDLVNHVFYTNANTSASTDFVVGPNI